jgi:hypothetical protein
VNDIILMGEIEEIDRRRKAERDVERVRYR